MQVNMGSITLIKSYGSFIEAFNISHHVVAHHQHAMGFLSYNENIARLCKLEETHNYYKGNILALRSL